ncbi:N-acetylglutamate synthase, GNAT family [Dyadobacter soli]|uniref:N-acetylglutamate synthase, GNAT family n=1 Tax=Dyadobacter soli TaxID=659014 RepID=A0A1G7VJS1_9BACT|nr:GNAT family N-acetyltransferase [Dyadobacter soli]SDG59801.1 N-acetylglutamate synthase, GNAT family [Dyadobacter soli]
MITIATDNDFDIIYQIINDSASAYKGVIPADRWQDPYMPKDELRVQIEQGVQFWKYTDQGDVLGVMGIQPLDGVTLIRHAYVRSAERGKGVGGILLEHLIKMTQTPILIGTWAQASWAIKFYEKHGFRLLGEQEKNQLLSKYWIIPERQKETSVVLANNAWK